MLRKTKGNTKFWIRTYKRGPCTAWRSWGAVCPLAVKRATIRLTGATTSNLLQVGLNIAPNATYGYTKSTENIKFKGHFIPAIII